MHRKIISWGLLSRLGDDVVTAFYSAICDSDEAFCLVAVEDGRTVGFVSGVLDWRRMRVQMLRRMWLSLVRALPALVRSAQWRRLVETERYTHRRYEGIRAEFLTLGVSVDAHARLWVGTALIHAAIGEFRRRGVTRVQGVVWNHNERAMRFFEAVGFRHVSDVEIHPGEVSKMLVVDLPAVAGDVS